MADEERLMILVEARLTDLERNMAKASATTGREFGKMRRNSKSAMAAMEQDAIRSSNRINQAMASVSTNIGALGKGAIGGIAGALAGIGLSQIISQARTTATEIANIGSQAERAGISAKAFQELGYVATQNRIPIDALTDGMKELALRADELIQTGAGPAAEAFHRLGLSSEDLKEKLKDPSALLVEIIGKLQQFDKASQIRISDELFGGSAGERFVELIDDGAAGIQKLIDEANAFGLVMDDAMIAKAAEVDRQFNIIAGTVGTGLKAAIVNAAAALSSFIDQFREFENQQASTLRSGVEENFKAQAAKRYEIDDLKSQKGGVMGGFLGPRLDAQIRLKESEISALESDYARMQAALDKQVLFRPGNEPRPVTAPVSTLNDKPFKVEKEKKAPRDAAAEKAKREAEAVRDLITELEREESLIGSTDVEREISNALRQAGAAATDEQKERITELVTAIETETKALETLKEAQDELKLVASDALHTIADGIRDGAEAGEILGNVLDNLSAKLIDMAIQGLVEAAFPPIGGVGGGGAGGGLLSGIMSLFGGGRATGGSVQAGKFYEIGEKGPELFAPGRTGTIIPNHALQSYQAQPSAAAMPAIHIAGASIVVQGDANAQTIAQMQAMLKERDRTMTAQVVAAMRDAQRRSLR